MMTYYTEASATTARDIDLQISAIPSFRRSPEVAALWAEYHSASIQHGRDCDAAHARVTAASNARPDDWGTIGDALLRDELIECRAALRAYADAVRPILTRAAALGVRMSAGPVRLVEILDEETARDAAI